MTPVKTSSEAGEEVRRQRKVWPVGRVKGRESSDLGTGSGRHPLRDGVRDLRVSGLGLDPLGLCFEGREGGNWGGGVDGGRELKVNLLRLLMMMEEREGKDWAFMG